MARRPAARRKEAGERLKTTPDGRYLSSYMLQTNGGGSLEAVPGFANRRAIGITGADAGCRANSTAGFPHWIARPQPRA